MYTIIQFKYFKSTNKENEPWVENIQQNALKTSMVFLLFLYIFQIVSNLHDIHYLYIGEKHYFIPERRSRDREQAWVGMGEGVA